MTTFPHRKPLYFIGHEPDPVDLARLLPLWPHELTDMSRAGRTRRCALLQRALRQERQRGLGGDWTYDLGRHAALRRHYERELAELQALRQAPGPARVPQPCRSRTSERV